MNLKTRYFFAYFIWVIYFHAQASLYLRDGDFCFCNKSTNEIVVTDIISDSKIPIVSCGILVPNGHASVDEDGMFPEHIPNYFQIKYQDSSGTTHTDKLDSSWIEVKKAKEGTIYFVYTPQQKFVLKVYLHSGDDMRLEGKLLPDENDPPFAAYKQLVRSAIDGNAQQVRELLAGRAPYVWPNEPVSLTPFGWSVRWNNQKAFDVLFNGLPKDFYPYEYYWSIQVAAQEGYTNILQKLLRSSLADNVPTNSLRQIFDHACTHTPVDKARTNEMEVLKILLAHFKVGIDFQVTDYGHTLLFVAVQCDDAELVKWLLSQGANPNAQIQNGDTPLKWARSEAVRKLLMDRGAQ